MSRTSADRKGLKKPIKTPTLDLPFGLREHILLNLLISPIPANVSALPTIWLLPQRTGQLYQKRLQMGNNKKLSQQFDTLCLVSRQMRNDAIKILFAHNLIVFHISLLREPRSPVAVTDKYSPARFICVNSLPYIKRIWGEEALLSIRNLGIWIGCGYKPGQDRLKRYLEDAVTSLKKSRCLQRLHIFWLNGHGVDSISSFNNNRTSSVGRQEFAS